MKPSLLLSLFNKFSLMLLTSTLLSVYFRTVSPLLLLNYSSFFIGIISSESTFFWTQKSPLEMQVFLVFALFSDEYSYLVWRHSRLIGPRWSSVVEGHETAAAEPTHSGFPVWARVVVGLLMGLLVVAGSISCFCFNWSKNIPRRAHGAASIPMVAFHPGLPNGIPFPPQ